VHLAEAFGLSCNLGDLRVAAGPDRALVSRRRRPSAHHVENSFLEMDDTSIVVDDKSLDVLHKLVALGD
jgi:hypothetical protein